MYVRMTDLSAYEPRGGNPNQQCTRDATQEDLLCDNCREAKTCKDLNGVLVWYDGTHLHMFAAGSPRWE
jgi:hypothetical protein